MVGPANHEGCGSATSETDLPTATGTIIVLHDRRLLADIVHGRNTFETRLQSRSINVRGGALVHHVEGADGIAVQALKAVRRVTAMRIYLFQGVLREKCQTCKYLL